MIFLFPRWDMLIPWRVFLVMLSTSKISRFSTRDEVSSWPKRRQKPRWSGWRSHRHLRTLLRSETTHLWRWGGFFLNAGGWSISRLKKKKWDGGSVRNRKISTRKCVNWIVWEIILDHFDHDVWLEVHWHFIEFFAQQSPDFCTSKKTSRCFLHTPGYGSIFLPTLIPLWLEWLVCVCVCLDVAIGCVSYF